MTSDFMFVDNSGQTQKYGNPVSGWFMSGCGGTAYTGETKDINPEAYTGITCMSGRRYPKIDRSKHTLKHIKTSNGILTVVLCHAKY